MHPELRLTVKYMRQKYSKPADSKDTCPTCKEDLNLIHSYTPNRFYLNMATLLLPGTVRQPSHFDRRYAIMDHTERVMRDRCIRQPLICATDSVRPVLHPQDRLQYAAMFSIVDYR
jgi:hypothetical protein